MCLLIEMEAEIVACRGEAPVPSFCKTVPCHFSILVSLQKKSVIGVPACIFASVTSQPR